MPDTGAAGVVPPYLSAADLLKLALDGIHPAFISVLKLIFVRLGIQLFVKVEEGVDNGALQVHLTLAGGVVIMGTVPR